MLVRKQKFYRHVKDLYSYVRVAYRTPTQLGLLEPIHRTFEAYESVCFREWTGLKLIL